MDTINKEYLTNRGKMVEAIPLRDQVADIIRKMILRGEIDSGQLLNERQISQQLEVSTTPVKEALRTLQTEGLVYTVARKGSVVAQFPRENALQVIYMRSALEGVAAYFAAQNATEKSIEQLETCLNRNDVLLQSPDTLAEIGQNNETFHTILRSLADNPYLIKLIQNLLSIDRTIRKSSLQIDFEEPGRAQKEHRAILEVVRQHDSMQAERLMTAHIRRVAAFVMNNADRI